MGATAKIFNKCSLAEIESSRYRDCVVVVIPQNSLCISSQVLAQGIIAADARKYTRSLVAVILLQNQSVNSAKGHPRQVA